MGFSAGTYRWLVAAHERVGGKLKADGRWHRDATCRAYRSDARHALLQHAVVGLDCDREAQIVLGIFVRAVDKGIGRQARQLLQRGQHLCRRSFEQPSTAAGEQRVAAEHHRCAVEPSDISDVATGMTRHIKHLQRQVDARHGNAFTA